VKYQLLCLRTPKPPYCSIRYFVISFNPIALDAFK
jgi:hypothetical protein